MRSRRQRKIADPFYSSPAWRQLRRQALQRDGERCVVCGVDVSAPGAARVDHIKTRRERPDLELALSNVRTLCSTHDNQGHREKRTGASSRDERFVIAGCDQNGLPADPNHPWRKM